MVHDYVIMLCYVILLQHDLIICYAVYIDIVIVRSFVINIFLFYFGGIKLAGKRQTTTPLMNGESVWYQQWSKSKTKIENEILRKKKFLKNVFCELESREPEIENEKFQKIKFPPYACVCV